MEICGLTLCSYIIVEPLLCMTSPWSMAHVLSSGVLYLCWSTSAYCRFLVRAWVHIVLLASLTSYRNRGRRESSIIINILFSLYLTEVLES
jgi:hypothetical protein